MKEKHIADMSSLEDELSGQLKGTLPRKSTWALNVQFSEKTTMVPLFIWV